MVWTVSDSQRSAACNHSPPGLRAHSSMPCPSPPLLPYQHSLYQSLPQLQVLSYLPTCRRFLPRALVHLLIQFIHAHCYRPRGTGTERRTPERINPSALVLSPPFSPSLLPTVRTSDSSRISAGRIRVRGMLYADISVYSNANTPAFK